VRAPVVLDDGLANSALEHRPAIGRVSRRVPAGEQPSMWRQPDFSSAASTPRRILNIGVLRLIGQGCRKMRLASAADSARPAPRSSRACALRRLIFRTPQSSRLRRPTDLLGEDATKLLWRSPAGLVKVSRHTIHRAYTRARCMVKADSERQARRQRSPTSGGSELQARPRTQNGMIARYQGGRNPTMRANTYRKSSTETQHKNTQPRQGPGSGRRSARCGTEPQPGDQRKQPGRDRASMGPARIDLLNGPVRGLPNKNQTAQPAPRASKPSPDRHVRHRLVLEPNAQQSKPEREASRHGARIADGDAPRRHS